MDPTIIVAIAAAVAVVLVALVVVASRAYKSVEPGFALIVNRVSRSEVSFTGAVVLPIYHRADVMDVRLKSIAIERTGSEGIICKDNLRADVRAVFYLRVNHTTEDVLKVARSIGCQRASDPDTLEELFAAKFSEALKTVFKHFDFTETLDKRDALRDELLQVIGADLNGYVLEDLALERLEMTPVAALDSANILDAEGITKIEKLTREQARIRRQLEGEHALEMQRLDADAKARLAELEARIAELDRELAKPGFGTLLS